MIGALTVGVLTCAVMIGCVIFLPRLQIKKFAFDTYWVVALLGALLMLVLGYADPAKVFAALTADTAINPLKIAVLFLSMTVLSVYLDEAGFFRYMANYALSRAGESQTRLFFLLYITVSVLTVFTSNDIIVLTFTPFICYFAANAGISPVPFLVSEFVAANTWSMALIIGNPTNVYLTTTYGIDFVTYLRVMALPTVAAGIAALLVLWLTFRRALQKKITPIVEDCRIHDRIHLVIGLVHLGVCTVLLAVASYINWPMWLIALLSAVSLCACTLLADAIRRVRPKSLGACVRRAPWPLIPFILSMFLIILALTDCGATAKLTALLGEKMPVLSYGLSSAVAANLINNIPMSVLYCSLAEAVPEASRLCAVYAAVIGSNLGALLTPIGALAGMMWTGILKKHSLRFGYRDFICRCAPVGLTALAAALAVLSAVL